MSEAYLGSEDQSFDPRQFAGDSTATAARPLSWVETFAGIIRAPVATMRELAHRGADQFVGITGIGGAALAVVLPFALDGLRMTSPTQLGYAWVNVQMAITGGVVFWLVSAGLISVMAMIFGAPKERCSRIFVLLGWSFVPWIFLAPLHCYREVFGSAFVLVASLPVIWSFVLQVIAVRETFQLKPIQLLALFFVVPLLFQAQQLLQLAQMIWLTMSSV